MRALLGYSLRLRLCCLLLGSLVFAAVAGAQRIEVSPQESVLDGDPVSIVVREVPPRATVRVTAERVLSEWDGLKVARVLYRASASYPADDSGRVELSTVGPTSGSYTGADPAGLFWSMVKADGSVDGLSEDDVRITAAIEGHPSSAIVIHVLAKAPNLSREEVAAFPGSVLLRPKDLERPPVIIVLGGSEGGGSFGRTTGALLASHGFAVLGLPYYSPDYGGGQEIKGLRADFADIPVDRLEAVRAWLQSRKDVDASRIGLYGVSKGGEFAAIAASRLSWLGAVAAVVPSDVVWEGWGPGVTADDTRSSFSWRGRPLPFVPYTGMRPAIAAMMTGKPVRLRSVHDGGRRAHPERVAAARIPIERYKGPLFLAGAMEDATWPSGPMVQNMAERRAASGLPTEALVFDDAGHGISGLGWQPTAGLPGGTAMGNARAQRVTWRRLLAFFERSLRSGRS